MVTKRELKDFQSQLTFACKIVYIYFQKMLVLNLNIKNDLYFSLELIIRPSFCQLIMGVGAPAANAWKTTGAPSLTVWFSKRSVNLGGAKASRATNFIEARNYSFVDS